MHRKLRFRRWELTIDRVGPILARMRTGLLLTLLLAALVAAGEPAPRRAAFDARNEFAFRIPEGAKEARIWIALPSRSDPFQTVADLKIEAPDAHSIAKDSLGNEFLYVEWKDPAPREFTVATSFRVTRSEARASVDPAKTRPLTGAERAEMAAYLKPTKYVVIDERIEKLAKEIVGDERNPIAGARRIYDWVLANIDYWVKDPANRKASATGSTDHCLTTKTGNCTDFHSLYMSIAMAAGIPTRITYGSFFKKELDGKDADQSYHCWLDVFAPQIGWVPIDVAVADIFVGDFKLDEANGPKVRLTTADGYEAADPAKVDYYFGAIEERRVSWHVGRDLAIEPAPASGPVNALPKAWVELDGKPFSEKDGWTRKLTFREVPLREVH